MDTTYEIIGQSQYRIFARGWWADVEYRWDRAIEKWQVAVLERNAYGRITLADIALATGRHRRADQPAQVRVCIAPALRRIVEPRSTLMAPSKSGPEHAASS